MTKKGLTYGMLYGMLVLWMVRRGGRPPQESPAPLFLKDAMTPKQIKALRQKLGLTHKVFAARVGVSERTAYRWEAGEAAPRSRIILDRLEKISLDIWQ